MLNLWELFGLYFGWIATGEIALLSFFVAAVICILILLYRAKIKSKDEYIPFGPFLVISRFFVMFAGDGVVLKQFVTFCKMISSKLIGGI